MTIEPATFRLGGGRLAVSGVVDPAASDLTLDIAGLPLALVDAFAPGTGLEGTLQAKARVTGALANPKVQATYSANGLRIKRPETALLPALAVQGTADMADRQASVDARVSAGGATNLGIKARAALAQGTATVQIAGTADLAPFSPALGLMVRNVTGTLRPDVTLNIAGNAVTGSGTITLANATLSLPASGLRLSGGQALMSLQGDTLQLQRLNFQTASNGSISATGTVRLDPAQGFPVDLAVTSQKALVASRPDLLATASGNIKIAGSSLSGFDVSGPITIDRAEIAIGAVAGCRLSHRCRARDQRRGAIPVRRRAASPSTAGAGRTQAAAGERRAAQSHRAGAAGGVRARSRPQCRGRRAVHRHRRSLRSRGAGHPHACGAATSTFSAIASTSRAATSPW